MAYANRGIVHRHKGDYDRAIADYSKAIELNPQYADAYYNRAIAYQHKGDNDRAAADANRAIALDPSKPPLS